MKTVYARYTKRCLKCGGAIRPGELINNYGGSHLVHAACDGVVDQRTDDLSAAYYERENRNPVHGLTFDGEVSFTDSRI